MKQGILSVFLIFMVGLSFGNSYSTLDSNLTREYENPEDSITKSKLAIKKNTKEGVDWVILPIPGYGSDIGLKYGLVFSLYNFSKPTQYPDFKTNIHLEVSRTTKGITDIITHFYSKKILHTNFNVLANIYYRNEFAYDFWGFNGSQSVYNRNFQKIGAQDFISEVFNKLDRSLLRTNLDFSYPIFTKLNAHIGWNCFNVKIKPASAYFSHRDSEIQEQDTLQSLFKNYINWQIIPESDKSGGLVNLFKAGLSFDNRNYESSPTKGQLLDLIFIYAPGLLQSNGNSFLKLSASFHKYINLYKDKIIFASRLMYQSTLFGKTPFYMQSFLFSTRVVSSLIEGLGGGKTIRGIDRNRVISDGFLLSNTEIRCNFFEFNFLKQSFSLEIKPFLDAGISTKLIEYDKTLVPDNSYIIPDAKDQIHAAAGSGFHIIMNKNINVYLDYGFSITKEPYKGFYLGFNYVF